MTDDELAERCREKHIELLAHLGYDKLDGGNISCADARWLMMRAAEHAHNLEPLE